LGIQRPSIPCTLNKYSKYGGFKFTWAKHGFEVDYDYFISAEDAHAAIPAGTVEFVSGNLISAYGARAQGDVGDLTEILKPTLYPTL